MLDNMQLVERAKEKNYLLPIYQASGNNDAVLSLATVLIKEINDIYKYFEPSLFTGDLIICSALNNELLIESKPDYSLFDKGKLALEKATSLFIQKTKDDLLVWRNVDINTIIEKQNVLFYLFTKDKECFIINTKLIYIEKLHGIYSFYSSYYAELDEKLAHYSIAKILKSSCHYFSKSWFDEKHIYFKNKPEEEMQISLKEFLSSALRNIEVVREFTLGAHKPVDIRVRWLSANRSALIEVKWLGNSLNNAGDALGTEYKNSRATEGIKQLKKYLELSERDMPETIAKAYLVVFDGRRRNISKRFVNAISEEDGLYYKSKDLKIPEEYDYHRKIHNFAKPIRMFASPICL